MKLDAIIADDMSEGAEKRATARPGHMEYLRALVFRTVVVKPLVEALL